MLGASTSRDGTVEKLTPTPQRVKKPLIDKAVGKIHDDRAKADEIDKNKGNEASSAKVDEVDKTNAVIVESKDDRMRKVPNHRMRTSPRVNATRLPEPRPMKSPRKRTAKFLRYAIQEQMWNKRQMPHSNGSNSSSAPQQSTSQKKTLHRVLSNELLNKSSTCLMRRSQYNSWTENHST